MQYVNFTRERKSGVSVAIGQPFSKSCQSLFILARSEKCDEFTSLTQKVHELGAKLNKINIKYLSLLFYVCSHGQLVIVKK